MNKSTPAIDVHAHYGSYRRDGSLTLMQEWLTADATVVADRAKRAGVVLTVVSPLGGLLPRGRADAVAANLQASQDVCRTTGLRQWVIVHPHQLDTFDQADELLGAAHCVGIKIHPEEHEYEITKHGDKLFQLAARHDAIVLAHSGDPKSWPKDFVPYADEYPNVRLILAHLGNGGGASGDATLQVRAIQESKHGNILVDTSSARSILPGLVEWAVNEIGSERVLFGTDAPLYSTAMQRSRIDSADLTHTQKVQILSGNASELLGVDISSQSTSTPLRSS